MPLNRRALDRWTEVGGVLEDGTGIIDDWVGSNHLQSHFKIKSVSVSELVPMSESRSEDHFGSSDLLESAICFH
jgi:hypothetical protein